MKKLAKSKCKEAMCGTEQALLADGPGHVQHVDLGHQPIANPLFLSFNCYHAKN